MNKTQNFIENLNTDTANYPARDIIYDFSQAYTKYMERLHDFGDGIKMTSVEAHTLKHICQNDGVTLTDIVNYWGRTKGTVSSQISALERKGYVYREKCKYNSKKIHIYPTEKGLEINQLHTEFDIKESTEWLEFWLKKYTIEDVEKLNQQIIHYTEFLNNKIK